VWSVVVGGGRLWLLFGVVVCGGVMAVCGSGEERRERRGVGVEGRDRS